MNHNILTRRRLVVLLGAVVTLALTVRGVLPLMANEVKSPVASPVLTHEGETIVIPPASALRDSLKTALIEQRSIAIPFSLPASVEADPARLAKILPPTTGRIVSIQKRLGDAVKAGDVLFEIESSDLAQAVSDERKAQSTLALTRRNLERQRSLDQANISARRDLEQAQSDYEQADSEAARAHARVAALGGTAASGGSARLAVRAPVSGHVIELNAAVGSFWNDNTASVMTVADLSSVYVTASAQEKDLARLHAGQDAEIALDAYPGQPLQAKVKSVGQVLDPDTRTVKVRILVANTDDRLKPGMFAQAILREQAHTGLLVPMTAVVQSGFANRVFVEVAPWKFEARKIMLGAQVGNDVEVTDGLQAGARVVVKDGVLLND
ncbi:cobalt-zinc-cadmium efflux system membrane fusion protein [Herbaspirillum rubrisubalbicans]|uniref:efflux RND transporter periplasmic adaptor subunit n=1 Tax=Herbaspirillum rubrisubalbicans TaxID=80842 RepID=UPI00209D1427|nr:efflux RND transporter periplasmic adaptor subunit [Herbaspirillum rubrisubalbicans]MCP1572406.1 cobalt-zinc-cadmium efflux system membrane fusion protein [Herbaspirillum rubrisubalbicans]